MLYEYKCKNSKCDTDHFDAYRSIKNRHNTVCPQCDKKAIYVFTGTASVFIPPWFHKPIPDSAIKAGHNKAKAEGRELQRVGRDDM